jgi:hypothetical protein
MSDASVLDIPGLDIPDELSPEAALITDDVRARFAAEKRVALTRSDCMTIGGWKLSTQINKERRGILPSFLDGVGRRITARSLYQHLIDLAVTSHPAGAPPAKARARQTAGTFRRRPFVPNEAQLEGLRQGNARRAAAARARREAADLET